MRMWKIKNMCRGRRFKSTQNKNFILYFLVYFLFTFQRIFLGDDFLKISCIKYAKDANSFKILENFGAKVVKLENPEDVDSEIKNLYSNNYKTIILSNEIASFSEDIIKKYNSTENISIIIAPKK